MPISPPHRADRRAVAASTSNELLTFGSGDVMDWLEGLMWASARQAAGVEKRLLLLGGGTAQQRVTVREGAEARDDVGVDLRIAVGFSAAGAARQRERALLVGEIFRMLERQVEEHALA